MCREMGRKIKGLYKDISWLIFFFLGGVEQGKSVYLLNSNFLALVFPKLKTVIDVGFLHGESNTIVIGIELWIESVCKRRTNNIISIRSTTANMCTTHFATAINLTRMTPVWRRNYDMNVSKFNFEWCKSIHKTARNLVCIIRFVIYCVPMFSKFIG